ncbi:MAG: ImmA/IrrE family metallo-endopeptidase [Planctomycetota bacterium]
MSINLAALGKRLKEARQNCGISQEEAAEAIDVPRTAIVHIESGNRSISTLELAGLAALYKRPIAGFFVEGAEEEEDVLVALNRVSADFKENPQVGREISRYVEICREGAHLEKLLGLPGRSGPPDYDMPHPDSVMNAVEQGQVVAEEERSRIGLGNNPIADVADLIASQGVWASGADLPQEMSGLFLRQSSIGMVILVNFHHARARKRFSYAHEYAHALLDGSHSLTVSTTRNRSDLIEVRANAFAAAFLLPAEGVRLFLEMRKKAGQSRQEQVVYDLLGEETGTPTDVKAQKRSVPGSQKITYEDVAALANRFRVSYQAACYRLKGLNAVNKEQLEKLLEQEALWPAYLRLLRLFDDFEGRDDQPDRKLDRQIISLAVEAFRREEISKGHLRDVGKLLGIPARELIALAEAARE